MTRHLKVLIVDDKPRARKSLRALLTTCSPVETIREAADGQEAVLILQDWQPDLVLMDMNMPGMDGLQATRLARARWPGLKILALSIYNDYAIPALAAGASEFVSKGESPAKLLEMIERILRN